MSASPVMRCALSAALSGALLLSASASAAGAGESAPAEDLRSCAVIARDAERLACYDRLAGRSPAPPAAASTVAAPPAAPAASPASFGLYTAEHPAAPAAEPILTARVLGVGTSYRGRMTLTLEGGALWELDDADPLLSAGDIVTIRRASFGSFLISTPTRREHRALRLR